MSELNVTETLFADYAALYSTSQDSFKSTTAGFMNVASEWGLTVSMEKTKGMVAGQIQEEDDMGSVELERGSLDIVNNFTYLGANISNDGEVTTEIDCRVAKAARAFGCLRKPIFEEKTFSVATKRKVYQAVVVSVVLYGAETWTLKAQHVKRLIKLLP